jgi:hypothetical protein
MQHIKNLFHRNKNENGKYTRPYYSIVSKKAGKVIDVAQDGPVEKSSMFSKDRKQMAHKLSSSPTTGTRISYGISMTRRTLHHLLLIATDLYYFKFVNIFLCSLSL